MGGLSALCRFVVPLAANFPAAIVVAIYNGPAAGSSTDESAQLPAIVGQHTRLPVLDAVDGAEFHPGSIYLAPQGHHLVVLPTGRFDSYDAAKLRYPAPAADPLFRSAAAAYGRRVTGIVQSPSDATARGMLTSALLSNHTDFCVLLDEMPKLLMSLVSPTGRAG